MRRLSEFHSSSKFAQPPFFSLSLDPRALELPADNPVVRSALHLLTELQERRTAELQPAVVTVWAANEEEQPLSTLPTPSSLNTFSMRLASPGGMRTISRAGKLRRLLPGGKKERRKQKGTSRKRNTDNGVSIQAVFSRGRWAIHASFLLSALADDGPRQEAGRDGQAALPTHAERRWEGSGTAALPEDAQRGHH